MDTDLNSRFEMSPVDGELSRDQSVSGQTSPSDFRDCSSVASSYQRHLTPYSDSNLISLIEEFNTLDSVPDEDSQSELVIDEIPPCLENALALNLAYQAFLEETLQQFSVLLDVNLEKQRNLQNTINQLTSKTGARVSDRDRVRAKKVHFSIFGAPYFKDADFNGPPKNEDTQMAEDLGFHNLALICSLKPLNKYEEIKLTSAVRAEGLRLKASELSKKRERLKLQLSREALSSEESNAMEEEIKTIGNQIFNLDKMKNEQLFEEPNLAIDWDKISLQDFYKTRKPSQLRCYWENYLCPRVYKGKWTVRENRQLKALVNKSPETADWEDIADKLGTNRTAFDCYARYQSRYNRKIRRFGWKIEDNEKLIRIIQSCFDSPESIDWNYVRLHFPGRTKNQIYSHWKYTLCLADVRPFSRAEDVIIVEGIKIGFDIRELSLLLGTRAPTLIRKRHKSLLCQGKISFAEWTPEEDKQLLSISDPSLLASHTLRNKFPGRILAQAVSRYHFLRMKQMENPREYVQMLPKEKHCLIRSWKGETFTHKISKIISRYGKPRIDLQGDSHWLTRRAQNKELTSTIFRTARSDPTLMNRKTGKPKMSLVFKERELKEIVRPLYTTTRRRPRISSYPGDGREHGLVLLYLYRLLRCHFTRMPDENCSEEELDALDIELQDQLPFQTFQELIKDLPPPHQELRSVTMDHESPEDERHSEGAEGQEEAERDITATETDQDAKPLYLFLSEQTSNDDPEEACKQPDGMESPQSDGSIYCLPPTLHSLTGFRGLLLHQRYLQKSANRKPNYSPSESYGTEAAPSTSQEADSLGPFEIDDAEMSSDATPGDAEADSLLLTRMLSIFYWPGVMSTITPPDDLEHDPRVIQSQADESVDKQTPRRGRKQPKSSCKPGLKTRLLKQQIEGQQSTESQSDSRPSSASSVTVSSAPSTPQPTESPPLSECESPPPTKKAKQPDEQSAEKKVKRSLAAKAAPTRVYRTRTSTRTQRMKNEQNKS